MNITFADDLENILTSERGVGLQKPNHYNVFYEDIGKLIITGNIGDNVSKLISTEINRNFNF